MPILMLFAVMKERESGTFEFSFKVALLLSFSTSALSFGDKVFNGLDYLDSKNWDCNPTAKVISNRKSDDSKGSALSIYQMKCVAEVKNGRWEMQFTIGCMAKSRTIAKDFRPCVEEHYKGPWKDYYSTAEIALESGSDSDLDKLGRSCAYVADKAGAIYRKLKDGKWDAVCLNYSHCDNAPDVFVACAPDEVNEVDGYPHATCPRHNTCVKRSIGLTPGHTSSDLNQMKGHARVVPQPVHNPVARKRPN